LLLSNLDDAVALLDCHAKQPRHWTEVLHVEPFAESRLEPNDEATWFMMMMMSSMYNAKK
jgi:hypothetical protein